MFTDESCFQLLNEAGGKTFNEKTNSESKTNLLIRTKKFLGVLVIVWEYISSLNN